MINFLRNYRGSFLWLFDLFFILLYFLVNITHTHPHIFNFIIFFVLQRLSKHYTSSIQFKFLLSNSDNHLSITSILLLFFADMLKQATLRSLIPFSSIWIMSCYSVKLCIIHIITCHLDHFCSPTTVRECPLNWAMITIDLIEFVRYPSFLYLDYPRQIWWHQRIDNTFPTIHGI